MTETVRQFIKLVEKRTRQHASRDDWPMPGDLMIALRDELKAAAQEKTECSAGAKWRRLNEMWIHGY